MTELRFALRTNVRFISCFLASIAGMALLMAFCVESSTIPDIKVKALNGKVVSTSTFTNNEKPFIILFWATWCRPCVEELDAIALLYEDWQKETGIKIIAISVDDPRGASKVSSFVHGREWPYDVYLDENSDFKRAMNVNECPYLLLINRKNEIAWQHKTYAPGDEEKILEEIKKVVSNK